ncbi:HNH endonuclease [Candidatus Saccharibacteria bacterium]|nr:HNH endonuclease [Candidatus Saccharibacteria bacterium]NCU38433.1 HNH endonuclease [Candidatus Saccharibacteria bacterium]
MRKTEEGRTFNCYNGIMNSPETRTNISPAEMHQKIVSKYGELPPKPNLAKALVITMVTIIVYFFVVVPIGNSFEDTGETINFIGFFFAASIVYGALSNYSTERNAREAEVNRRQKVKSEYDRMNKWYTGEESIHRYSTTTDAGRAAYPADWADRKRYVKTRDGACYLCTGTRDNDRYYFYRPRDGRHLNKSGKDFALYDQVHHIVPISKGGTHEVSNLVFLCNLCHEDQHLHLLRRRMTTLERKSKQARNPALKAFWSSRLNDIRRRLSSLEQHNKSSNALKLHRLTETLV